jgi:hypothetical protein
VPTPVPVAPIESIPCISKNGCDAEARGTVPGEQLLLFCCCFFTIVYSLKEKYFSFKFVYNSIFVNIMETIVEIPLNRIYVGINNEF